MRNIVWILCPWAALLAAAVACATTVPATPQPPNAPPELKLVSPGAGRMLYRDTLFTIAAEAADPDGFVRKLDFYVDGP